MIRLGLTGGIGSGKSTVARLFELLGVPVFDSDKEAKNLYKTDGTLKESIIKRFGNKSYSQSGEINKPYFISFIFSDQKLLKDLNDLVHPRVKVCFDKWLEKHSNNPIIIKEAAILFESGAHQQVDKTLVVISPLEMRINRVIERDKTDRDKVLQRIDKQWPQEKLIKMADFTIDNSGKKSVIVQVTEIYNKLLLNCNASDE